MKQQQFIVIGMADSPCPHFTPQVESIIRSGRVFSGGKRHHELVAPLLPAQAQWLDITVPLDDVFEQYGHCADGQPVIVFASGDPLFFGFANTIRRRCPGATITVYPSFNSLQLLAHRLLMPYHDLRVVSLTGRPWQEFDRALIERAQKIGILTDREHTPATIAQRMLDYGYADYTVHVGQRLGNPEQERVLTLTPVEAARSTFDFPNSIILEATAPANRTYGLPDSAFVLLDGREKMITKMPVRLLTLQALELPARRVFWDIGFCTGSVSVEARLQFPHLRIDAFEVRPQCEAIISQNARRHGAPGINVHMGDFISVPLPCANDEALRPDAVFIGGHGGRLCDIMKRVLTVLRPGGIIVFNSVSSPVVASLGNRSSRALWDEACQALHLRQEPPLHIALNEYNPIEILKARY